MKKLTILPIVVVLVLSSLALLGPLAVVQAQTLTRAEVRALTPSLVNLLGGLRTSLTRQQRLIASQNREIASFRRELQTINATLTNLSNQNLSGVQQGVLDSQLSSLSQTVSQISTRATAIQNQRTAFNTAVGGIAGTLGNIVTMISQAVP